MNRLRDDAKIAVRRMRRRPLTSVMMLLTFCLGVAAVTTIASLVDAVLLRPLPLRAADELVWIWNARLDRDRAFFSVADWIDFRDRQRSLAGLAAVTNWAANRTGFGQPERVQGVRATGNLFEVLGATAAAGRLFQTSDGQPAGAPVVVVTWAYWQRTFGGDASSIGRPLTLNGEPYVLVGVLPREFPTRFPGTDGDADVFTLIVPEREPRLADRDDNFLRGIGRLAAGVTLGQAREDFARIQNELRDEYPETNLKKAPPRLSALRPEIVGELKSTLSLLAGAVALMVALACLNVSSVLFAEGLARDRELAMRVALGARLADLMRQLLTESLALAVAGGALGLALAPALLHVCLRLAPPAVVPSETIGISAAALTVALAVIAASGVAVGLLPARHAARPEIERAVRDSGKGSTAAGQSRALGSLLAVEIAFGCVLLAAAGVFALSLRNVASVDPGFEPRGVLTARFAVAPDRYGDIATFMRFHDALERSLAAEPGVEAVALANVLPLSGLNVRSDFTIVGHDAPSAAEIPGAQVRYVTEEYFRALRIPLVRGSDFGRVARAEGRFVATIDEAAADRFFGGRDPIGEQILLGGAARDIVGVVANVKHNKLDDPPRATVYVPLGQIPADAFGFLPGRFSLVVRTAAQPATLIEPLQRDLRAIDPDVPASLAQPFADSVDASLGVRRLIAVLFAVFSGASVALAMLGAYGLAAQMVVLRTREIGIRMALGATAAGVFRRTVTDGIRWVVAGSLGGLVAARLLGRFVQHLLYGVGASDPLPLVAAVAVMLVAAGSAIAIAARRAARTSPVRALAGG